MKAIELEHLTKYYGKNRGISDVCMSVDEGDFFGFIGPNGAGKSTTIRILLGLIRPSGGSASVFGIQAGAGKRSILSDVGYLPSEAMFYSGLKVRDILKFSAELRGIGCRKEAGELCEQLELDTDKRIDQLSLGNRKKVGIVCAMQHRPRLYIMDEPTSGLDPLMQRQFYSLLCRRNSEGATVFMSSHILSEVQRYCKHAAVIRDGRIFACDSIEKLGHTAAKRVTVRGVGLPPSLEGMRDVKLSADGVSFLFGGDMQALTRSLSELPFTDLTITEPDLEEIFLHYYGKEDVVNDHI